MSKNNKVLILSYYWPPSGGAGVQRWLKFAKYLVELGWEVSVYCPKNPEYPSTDEGLLKEVPKSITLIQSEIWEPYSWYKKLTGAKKEEGINTGFLSETAKPKKTEALARWIRGNFFIPDARKFWIKPSIKFLNKYLEQHPQDLLISTGPPHSMHLIAQGIKKQHKTPWLADFRDPWTNIDFYEELQLSAWADRKHHQLEQSVCDDADALVVVGKTMKDEFSEITSAQKIKVIPNGYDEADYQDLPQDLALDAHFTLAHIGSFSPSRNIPALWEALAELCKSDAQFKTQLRIKLIGKVDFSVMEALRQHGLESLVEKVDYLPHQEVLKAQASAQMLLLIVNQTKNAKGIVTGKVFEYLRTGRPILAIAPEDGDLSAIFKSLKRSPVADYHQKDKIKAQIISAFRSFSAGENTQVQGDVATFSRKTLSKELDELMKELIANHPQ